MSARRCSAGTPTHCSHCGATLPPPLPPPAVAISKRKQRALEAAAKREAKATAEYLALVADFSKKRGR